MSEIKKLLHRYLCEDAIKVWELAEKADDFVWLEKQGYYVRKTGEKTQKGKAYMKKHNEMMEYHFGKISDGSLDDDNLNILRKALGEYIKKNPEIDVFKELTEAETFAFRNVFYNHW